jgi:hypothetical protein
MDSFFSYVRGEHASGDQWAGAPLGPTAEDCRARNWVDRRRLPWFVVDGYEFGVNAYIQKSVDFEEFRRVIEQMASFWLVVNQPPPRAAFGH